MGGIIARSPTSCPATGTFTALRAKDKITERAEIPADDQDALGVDEDVEEADQDAEEGQEKEEEVVLEPPSHRRDMIQELWPFAYPSGYYKHILGGIGSKGAPSHLVVVRQSAHPGPILAARSHNMSSHAVYPRVSERAKSHGRKILRDCIYTDFVKEGRKQQSGEKRVFVQESGFVVLHAPEGQTVLFEQVALGATWRSGFDQHPAPDFLERAVLRLLQEELDSTLVAISEIFEDYASTRMSRSKRTRKLERTMDSLRWWCAPTTGAALRPAA